jgi:hypothetical protein
MVNMGSWVKYCLGADRELSDGNYPFRHLIRWLGEMGSRRRHVVSASEPQMATPLLTGP